MEIKTDTDRDRSAPAADGGLEQGGDAHTEEDGADELACSPLVEPHTHGLRQQEGHSDRPAEARQVVLWRHNATIEGLCVCVQKKSHVFNYRVNTVCAY